MNKNTHPAGSSKAAALPAATGAVTATPIPAATGAVPSGASNDLGERVARVETSVVRIEKDMVTKSEFKAEVSGLKVWILGGVITILVTFFGLVLGCMMPLLQEILQAIVALQPAI